jgi:DNA polymerase-3 subunit beta
MFTVNRKALSAELSLLQSVAETKGTIPILQSVKIEAVNNLAMLTANSLDAAIETQIECSDDFSACIPLRPLASLVKLLDEDDVSFVIRDTRVEVSAGRSRHRFPFEPLESFPETIKPQGETVTVDGCILGAMIDATSFWLMEPSDGLATNDFKYTGLSIRSNGQSLEVMASRKVTTAVATLDIAMPEFKTVVFRQTLAPIKAFTDGVTITTDNNHAMFQCGGRTVITRQIEGEFPEWQKFMPEMKYAVKIPESLPRAIQRSEITSDRAALKITFAKDSIGVESYDGTEGKAEETLSATSNMNGESISMGMFGRQVLEALRGQAGVTCQLAGADKPVLFQPTTKDFSVVYIVMPAALKW